jgi:hypothetical protein
MGESLSWMCAAVILAMPITHLRPLGYDAWRSATLTEFLKALAVVV